MKRLNISTFFGILLVIITLFYIIRTFYYYQVTRQDVQDIIYQSVRSILLESQDRIKDELSRDEPHPSTIRNLITRISTNNDLVSTLYFVDNNTIVFSSKPQLIGKQFSLQKGSPLLEVSAENIFDTPILYYCDTYYKQGTEYPFCVTAEISQTFIQKLFYDKMKHFFIFSTLIPILLILLIWWLIRRMIIIPIESLENVIKTNSQTSSSFIFLKEIDDLSLTLKSTFRRIDKQVQALEYMAHHDMLTGLPNRNFMQNYIDAKIHEFAKSNHNFTLLYLDLDNFKQINDTQGHDVGDIILKEIGSRLQKLSNTNEVIGRIGGDEFLYFTPHCKEENILKLIEQIHQCISKPIVYQSHRYNVGVSIGIAQFPQDGNNKVLLIKNADIALYEAKHTGRNHHIFFNEKLSNKLLHISELEQQMEKSLIAGDFKVYYQPQIEVKTNTIFSMEALLRWDHPTYGIINPDKFIPIAEQSGFIDKLGYYVLEQTCKTIQKLEKLGYPLSISVNLSTLQIRPALIEEIDTLVSQYAISPKKLHLEITESILMENLEHTIQILQELHTRGYSISLDDFGTGYSSLAYLGMLPISILKIDKSFTLNITTEETARTLVRSIIILAHALNLKVVAEGVEIKEHLDFLQKYECDSYQGYLFSQALPLDELIKTYFSTQTK